MNYNQANEYLNKIYTRGSHPGLSRITALLKLLGNPQSNLKIIHVTGTNGKGSVCVMLEQILCASGIKTGLFTSPSINRPNDCYRINGIPILDKDFADIVEHVKFREAMMTAEKPTGFEFETAAALELFRQKECEVVILEAGMGGGLDATNVCDTPLLSVITDVALDHEKYLGNTVKEIAAEKSGIIKNGRPVVFGGYNKDALDIIKSKAKETKSELIVTDDSRIKELKFSLNGTEFKFDLFGKKNTKFSLGLLGVYQPKNALTVLTAAEALNKYGININADSAATGIKNAVWRGRFEIINKNPLIIYDGAHNPNGMKMCAESIARYFKNTKVNILMGVMADKNYSEMLKILCPHIKTAFTVTPNNPRALNAEKLSESFKSLGINSQVFETIGDGAKYAAEYSKKYGIPLIVLGTLYMYKDVMTELIK